ncbi:MAG: hypothetical protein ACTSPN_04235 [Promethearchaeota archaeon]
MNNKAANDRIYSFKADNQKKIEFLQVLGCICCGSVRNLIPYDIDNFYCTIKHLNVYQPLEKVQTNSDFIPVCIRCSIEFQRWMFFYSNFMKIKFFCIIFYLLSVIGILTLISSHLLQTISIILITTYFFRLNFHLSKKINCLDYDPHDFIDNSKSEILLKHQGSKKWLNFNEWIKETIYYRLYIKEGNKIPTINYHCSDFTKCCYCGAKVLKNDIKCVKCERFLPLII